VGRLELREVAKANTFEGLGFTYTGALDEGERVMRRSL
jgi:hypothetical protein